MENNLTFEQLPLDPKYKIFEKMSGIELLKICNTSKTMRDMCGKINFHKIWQQKIKEDFKVDYHDTDSYLEYLRLSYTKDRLYWIVSEINFMGEVYTTLFFSEEEAINFILENLEIYARENMSEILEDLKLIKFLLDIRTYISFDSDDTPMYRLEHGGFNFPRRKNKFEFPFEPIIDDTMINLYNDIKPSISIEKFSNKLYESFIELVNEIYLDEIYEGTDIDDLTDLLNSLYTELINIVDNIEKEKCFKQLEEWVESFHLDKIANYSRYSIHLSD